MPMPPPKPSTEGAHEFQEEKRQLVRALHANGPQPPEQLATLVGAPYWREGTFARVMTAALADGLLHRTSDGLLAAP